MLLAAGKPLGTHESKRTRCIGLLKFVRNLYAHKAEHVEHGRFESEAAIADYIRLSLPWLLMTVHTLDAKHKQSSVAAEQLDTSAVMSEEDKRLRRSLAANVSWDGQL